VPQRKAEYREGQEAREEFERAMTVVFRAPKVASKKERAKDQPATLRKNVKRGKD